MSSFADADRRWMRRALSLARRAVGHTSPNPLVGAVLVRKGRCLGEGWHHRAGAPHAEIEALTDCRQRGANPAGATLYVTLEPCSTQGRTPPCTQAVIAAGIREVVVAAIDPNPLHAGQGLEILRSAGVKVRSGLFADTAAQLNAAFNHWIVHRTPLITLKAALTLDGRIATATGESRWITGEAARRHAMRLRQAHDAILVGVNTVRADDPQLTVRRGKTVAARWRVVLDTRARIPLTSRLVTDSFRQHTLVVVGEQAPARRLRALQARVPVLIAPEQNSRVNLSWLVQELGRQNITSLLVEGGGEVHASFLMEDLAHRLAFYYAPLILGGRDAKPGVGGAGFTSLAVAPRLSRVVWRSLGMDWLLTADLSPPVDSIPKK